MVRSTTHAAAVLNGQASESDGDTGKGHEEKEVASLLDRLRSPTPTDIARSRKIRSNQLPGPPRGKRTCRGALASDPKGSYSEATGEKSSRQSRLLSVMVSSSVQRVVNSSASSVVS